MKRTLKTLVIVMQIALLAMPSQSAAADGSAAQAVAGPVIVAPSSEPLVATTPDIIMTAFATGDHLETIEFYNQSASALWLGDVAVMTRDDSGMVQTIPLQPGFLLSKRYITFAANTALIQGALAFGGDQQPTTGNIVSISIVRDGSTTQSVNVPLSSGNVNTKDNYSWAQHKQRGNTTLKQTGDFSTDFTRKTTALTVEGTELYAPSLQAPDLHITEIHANPVDCEPVAASVLNLACGDYIKVINNSETPINLANYRLRVGAFGDTPGISTSFNWQQSTMTPEDEYWLNPHDFLVVHLRDDLKPLALTASGKYVWIEDYFGTTTYESVAYPDMTLAKYTGLSWALDSSDATWKAGRPSPETFENLFPPAPDAAVVEDDTSLDPCGAGQYRSSETNRCRTLVTTTLTPCREGQYRSEETNRCRSIVQTVAASLKPCSDDQFRNPLTGRCKKIASTDDIIQPCDAGWERNPETNRCRKVKASSMPLAAFPVEQVAPATAHQTTALVVGGVLAGALGYAAWEWRREIGAILGSLVGRFRIGR